MATQRRRSPADHTGAQREQLEKEHASEMAQRAEELGMATQAAAKLSDEVVDYTQPPTKQVVEIQEPEIVGGEDDIVEIRINTDLEQVTIGAGNNYDFKEGGKYRVPVMVARHLEEKGYVWH